MNISLTNPTSKMVGATLRSMRLKADLTQEELGDRAKVHRNTISAVERGIRSVTIRTLRKIAMALGYRMEINFMIDNGV